MKYKEDKIPFGRLLHEIGLLYIYNKQVTPLKDSALYGLYSLVARLYKLTRSFLKFCDSRIKIRTAHFV